MHFRHLALSGAVMALASTAAQAAPRLQAHPVRLVGYEGDDLRIAVELPCGSDFYGLIAASNGKGKLALAAASLQPDILCTSLPEERTFLIKYLATSGFEAITTMATEGLLNRLAMIPVDDVLVAKTKGGRRILRASYSTRCGESVGALIRDVGGNQLEVAMLELKERLGSAASARLAECNGEQKLRPITAVALEEGYEARPLEAKKVDMLRVSYLRLAPIDGRRLAAAGGKNEPVEIPYYRACNEAPVGVVVSKATIRSDNANRAVREVAVGVVVAHYLNKRCESPSAGEWSVMRTRDLSLSSSDSRPLRLTALPASDAREGFETLRLKSPYELDRFGERGPTRGLMIDFYKNTEVCEETVGAVYARDANGSLAVGVLTRLPGGPHESPASRCKKASTRVSSKASMMQPFLSSRVRAADLSPMRIVGH